MTDEDVKKDLLLQRDQLLQKYFISLEKLVLLLENNNQDLRHTIKMQNDLLTKKDSNQSE